MLLAILSRKGANDMSKKRFFCCIGNPPYQEEVDKDSENKTYAPPYTTRCLTLRKELPTA